MWYWDQKFEILEVHLAFLKIGVNHNLESNQKSEKMSLDLFKKKNVDQTWADWSESWG